MVIINPNGGKKWSYEKLRSTLYVHGGSDRKREEAYSEEVLLCCFANFQ